MITICTCFVTAATYNGLISMVAYTLHLPDDTHRRAKSTAALRGLTLRQLIQRAVERELVAQAEPTSEPDPETTTQRNREV
jgi:hypothetical protein